MATGRKELDIQKSSNNFRNVSIIDEQVNLANEISANKSKEEMSSKELKNQGIIFNEKSDYKSAQEFLNAALLKVEQESLSENEKNLIIAECYYGLGNCERELGHPNEAIELFIKAKKQTEIIIATKMEGLHDIKYHIARNIGIAYLLVEDYDNAAANFYDATNVALTANQVGRIPAVKSYYGLSLVLAGKSIMQGFQVLAEARELYPKNGREDSMDWAAHRYHMARAYEAVNNDINALVEYSESRRLRIQIIDRTKIGSVYYHSRVGDSNAGLGRVCLSLGSLKEAVKYLTEALENYDALSATKKADAIRKLLLKAKATSSLPSSTQTSSNMFSIAPQNVNVVGSSRDTHESSRIGLRRSTEEKS